ncbi:MAG: YraN family protein [Gammaproteobacteria bacterium]
MTAVGRRDSGGRGRRAEDLAVAFLARTGLELIERNYAWRGGEMDAVMRDGETLVFVEVRYRRDASRGGGAGSIDSRKLRRLLNTARHYIAARLGGREPACRFDVVVVGGELEAPLVEWIPDAFHA